MRTLLVSLMTTVLAMTFISPCLAPSIFTDQGNGTLKQNSTGLVWLANPTRIPGPTSMAEAKAWVATLTHGEQGLEDHSQAGDWRLPTAEELLSWGKKSDSSTEALENYFAVATGSRGYIGMASGRFNADMSIWVGGIPIPLACSGQTSGSGE